MAAHHCNAAVWLQGTNLRLNICTLVRCDRNPASLVPKGAGLQWVFRHHLKLPSQIWAELASKGAGNVRTTTFARQLFAKGFLQVQRRDNL